VCGGSASSQFAGVPVLPGSKAADFSLHDQDGRLVRLSAQRGRLVLLAFLYTHCVDFCPFVAIDLNAAVRELGHEARSVRILAVSVDPRYDTLPAVRRYARVHRLIPQFRWLHGSRAQLAPVWQAYNVLVEQRSPELVSHSAHILLIDARGKPVVAYPSTVSSRDVAHDLRLLMRQPA
jgi:protein SCO1/2